MTLELLIALIIIGALLYALQLLHIDATIKRLIQIIAIVIIVIWLLREFWPHTGLG
jgi:hypothetical protein